MLANQWSGIFKPIRRPRRWPPVSREGSPINIPANQLAGISTNQKTKMLANQWVDNFDPDS